MGNGGSSLAQTAGLSGVTDLVPQTADGHHNLSFFGDVTSKIGEGLAYGSSAYSSEAASSIIEGRPAEDPRDFNRRLGRSAGQMTGGSIDRAINTASDIQSGRWKKDVEAHCKGKTGGALQACQKMQMMSAGLDLSGPYMVAGGGTLRNTLRGGGKGVKGVIKNIFLDAVETGAEHTIREEGHKAKNAGAEEWCRTHPQLCRQEYCKEYPDDPACVEPPSEPEPEPEEPVPPDEDYDEEFNPSDPGRAGPTRHSYYDPRSGAATRMQPIRSSGTRGTNFEVAGSLQEGGVIVPPTPYGRQEPIGGVRPDPLTNAQRQARFRERQRGNNSNIAKPESGARGTPRTPGAAVLEQRFLAMLAQLGIKVDENDLAGRGATERSAFLQSLVMRCEQVLADIDELVKLRIMQGEAAPTIDEIKEFIGGDKTCFPDDAKLAQRIEMVTTQLKSGAELDEAQRILRLCQQLEQVNLLRKRQGLAPLQLPECPTTNQTSQLVSQVTSQAGGALWAYLLATISAIIIGMMSGKSARKKLREMVNNFVASVRDQTTSQELSTALAADGPIRELFERLDDETVDMLDTVTSRWTGNAPILNPATLMENNETSRSVRNRANGFVDSLPQDATSTQSGQPGFDPVAILGSLASRFMSSAAAVAREEEDNRSLMVMNQIAILGEARRSVMASLDRLATAASNTTDQGSLARIQADVLSQVGQFVEMRLNLINSIEDARDENGVFSYDAWVTSFQRSLSGDVFPNTLSTMVGQLTMQEYVQDSLSQAVAEIEAGRQPPAILDDMRQAAREAQEDRFYEARDIRDPENIEFLQMYFMDQLTATEIMESLRDRTLGSAVSATAPLTDAEIRAITGDSTLREVLQTNGAAIRNSVAFQYASAPFQMMYNATWSTAPRRVLTTIIASGGGAALMAYWYPDGTQVFLAQALQVLNMNANNPVVRIPAELMNLSVGTIQNILDGLRMNSVDPAERLRGATSALQNSWFSGVATLMQPFSDATAFIGRSLMSGSIGGAAGAATVTGVPPTGAVGAAFSSFGSVAALASAIGSLGQNFIPYAIQYYSQAPAVREAWFGNDPLGIMYNSTTGPQRQFEITDGQ